MRTTKQTRALWFFYLLRKFKIRKMFYAAFSGIYNNFIRRYYMGLESVGRASQPIFEAISPKSIPESERQIGTLQLPQGSGSLQVTFHSNTTNNIKEAKKHPIADIIHATGKLMISFAMGAATFLLTKRTIDLGASIETIQSALRTISSLGR